MISKLRIQYFATIAVVLVLVVLYEFCGLDKPTFLLNPVPEFWFSTVVTLLTIALVPISLKLLNFQRVRQELKEGEGAYFRWATIRWLLLSLVMVADTVAYYLFTTGTSCGYLGLICAVSYLFIWPSASRMEDETQS